jgi:hypothetical protein
MMLLPVEWPVHQGLALRRAERLRWTDRAIERGGEVLKSQMFGLGALLAVLGCTMRRGTVILKDN